MKAVYIAFTSNICLACAGIHIRQNQIRALTKSLKCLHQNGKHIAIQYHLENHVMITVDIKNWGLSKFCQKVHNIHKINISQLFLYFLNKIDQECNNQ